MSDSNELHSSIVLKVERAIVIEHAALVGRIAAGIAHDLNNPLAAILGTLQAMSLEMSRGGAPSAIALGADLCALEKLTTRTAGLVRDFLEFSRPLPATPKLRPVPIEPAVDQCMRLLAYASIRARTGLVRDGEGPKPGAMVKADPDFLRHLLVELVHNAILASFNDHVTVWVGASTRAGRFEIRVDDCGGAGNGAHVQDLKPLPFEIARASGTGMGLQVAAELARLMGGELILGHSPEGGSRATLVLDRASSGDAT